MPLTSNEVVVALISVGGVLLSAMISFLISARIAKRDIEQRRQAIKEVYTSSLHSRRLEKYSLLYFHLSNLGKRLLYKQIDHKSFGRALADIDQWDSENALICSAATLRKLLELRKQLFMLAENHIDDVNHFEVNVLLGQLVDLEMTLRTEIGVFSPADFHSPEGLRQLHVSWSGFSGDIEYPK